MESRADLEWADRLAGLLTADDSMVDETYRRRQYSQRACPKCTAQTLVRCVLPGHLRLLRRIKIDLRHYVCETCGHDLILRHREPR